ncbi:hypothetical protein SAMN04488541_100545 [Thermoflexibacter ruber]|uniref:Uncharacterized protein n=1 Tax=Thermoflexibacter ruber TaxID=1003 RepID=A0A1I2CK02_9BACT|nr:hypothetical protein SAMN04488541_100545 [Thermoflexibacter ruber]
MLNTSSNFLSKYLSKKISYTFATCVNLYLFHIELLSQTVLLNYQIHEKIKIQMDIF